MSLGHSRYIPMSYYDSLADARKTLKENSLISLELQTNLRDWLDRRASKDAYAHFMQVYGFKKVGDEEERERLGGYLHTQVKEVVSNASTYYVSPDMCELVKMAAEDMPASGLLPTDLPTDTGFLVYDRPVTLRSMVDRDGGIAAEPDDAYHPGDTATATEVETRIAAIAWRAGMVRRTLRREDGSEEEESVPGITYFLFQTPHDMAVTVNLSAVAVGDEPYAEPDSVERSNGPLPIWDFSGWAYNTPWHATVEENYGHALYEGEQDPLAGVHSIVDQARRLMLSTWRILNQKNIVTRDPNRPPRQMRRRAERVGVQESGDIVIIRMRREVYVGMSQAAGVEEGESWYSIRFPVRGHWHNYWVGPRGNQHLVPKYVAPYEKGPEGAPFVATRKIGSLER